MKSLLISLLLSAPSDSVLSPDKFAKQVARNHPSILVSQIAVSAANSKVLSARSFTEPSISLSHDRKKYDAKNYWNLLGGELKVPTVYGVNFYGAFDKNSGAYINPEKSTPIAGLYAGGIEIPIGRDLWMNKGRLSILKARIGVARSEQILRQSINETLYDAMNAYWYWTATYHILENNRKAKEISYQQLQIIKSLAYLGERPIIDTLESHIQWQNRTIIAQEAEADYLSASQELRTYLWNDSLYWQFQDKQLIPSDLEAIDLEGILIEEYSKTEIDSILQNHPVINDLNLQSEQVRRDIQFSKNQLLPKLSFKYNMLGGVNERFVAAQTLGTDYYKASVSFGIPLFLRKERANLQLGRLKQNELNYKTQLKSRELDSKLQSSYINYKISLSNTSQMRSTVANFYTLMRAEEVRFQNGESSVFLINQRENMYFQSQAKLINLEIKWRQNLLKYHLYRGDLDKHLLSK